MAFKKRRGYSNRKRRSSKRRKGRSFNSYKASRGGIRL